MADISQIKTLDGTTHSIKAKTIADNNDPTKAITVEYSSAGISSATWFPAFSGYAIKPMSAANVRTNIGAAAASHTHNYAGSSSAGGPASSLEVGATYSAPQNAIVTVNPAAAIQSPIPKYLWHDVWAFCRVCTPTFYTTTNGSTWTAGILEKRLFTHQEHWGNQTIINSTYSGARWVWGSGGFAYSSVAWIVIGVTYKASVAKFDIILESSTGNNDSATWTTLANVSGVNVNQQPVWIKCNGPAGENNMRLTIKRNSASASTTELGICSLRLLSSRWGDQGQGSEYENPFQWNGTPDIYPILNNAQSLGTSDYKWKDVQTTSLNGTTVPASPKFTDTKYTANTTKLVTTTVPNVTSVGSAPTLGTAIAADDITAWDAGSTPTLGTAIAADDITAWSAGTVPTLGTAIAADDITGWTTNTPTAASVSKGVLTITAGSAAALNYTARSIPNVTSVGTAPSLSYTARSIPNVTSVGSVPSLSYTARSIPNVTSVGSAPTLGTAITVATGATASNGGGSTVATGITAS